MFNLTRPDVRFGSHNLQDCKLILQDWIHNLQDFKLVLYMSKILKCRTWKGQSYMRFQDCNGLLQGRIHDGVMCVLLHQGGMWLYMQLLGCLLGLCFLSLHTVIKNLLRNSLGTIFSSFSKAYVQLVLKFITSRPNWDYQLLSQYAVRNTNNHNITQLQ